MKRKISVCMLPNDLYFINLAVKSHETAVCSRDDIPQKCVDDLSYENNTMK